MVGKVIYDTCPACGLQKDSRAKHCKTCSYKYYKRAEHRDQPFKLFWSNTENYFRKLRRLSPSRYDLKCYINKSHKTKKFYPHPEIDGEYVCGGCRNTITFTGKPSKRRGIPLPLDRREKLKISHKGQIPWNKGRYLRPFNTRNIRRCAQYLFYRLTVFERDNYTCQWQGCGKRGGRLHVHHIIRSFKILLDSNNISTMEQAYSCSELFDPVNGITICEGHHRLTPDYARAD